MNKKLDACELDDIDGLSADDMAEVVRHECSVKAPFDAQQVADDQADAWGRYGALAWQTTVPLLQSKRLLTPPAAAPHAGT